MLFKHSKAIDTNLIPQQNEVIIHPDRPLFERSTAVDVVVVCLTFNTGPTNTHKRFAKANNAMLLFLPPVTASLRWYSSSDFSTVQHCLFVYSGKPCRIDGTVFRL